MGGSRQHSGQQQRRGKGDLVSAHKDINHKSTLNRFFSRYLADDFTRYCTAVWMKKQVRDTPEPNLDRFAAF
jgi:hypothetical protein